MTELLIFYGMLSIGLALGTGYSLVLSTAQPQTRHENVPSDESLLKLFYLPLRNISRKWSMPIRD